MKRIGIFAFATLVLGLTTAMFYPKSDNIQSNPSDTEIVAFNKMVSQFQTIENLKTDFTFDYSTEKFKPLSSQDLKFFPDAVNSEFSREGPEDFYVYRRLKTNPDIIALITMQKAGFQREGLGSLVLQVFDKNGKFINSRYLSSSDYSYLTLCQSTNGQKFTQKQYQITNYAQMLEAKNNKTNVPKAEYKEEGIVYFKLETNGKITEL